MLRSFRKWRGAWRDTKGSVRYERTRQAGSRPSKLRFEPLESRRLLSADATVVFNEIMYAPASGNTSLQWLELTSQMAVDMDISGWRVEAGFTYEFPQGTILSGGEYLVLAASPEHVAAETGFAEAIPWGGGDLSNAGEQITLRNNSGRLMDQVEYDDDGLWSAIPDGSGASLAKIDPMTSSAPAENWTFSPQVNGTPGEANFPNAAEITEASILDLDTTWTFNVSGMSPAVDWNTLAFDDGAWGSGEAPFFAQAEAGLLDTEAQLAGNGGLDTLTAKATADNHFAVYVGNADGSNLRLVGRDTQTDWMSVETFQAEIGPSDYVFLAAWEALGDSGSPQMVIGEFTLSDGTRLGTNATDWQYILGPDNATPGSSIAVAPPTINAIETLVADAEATSSWQTPQAERDRLAGPWGSAVGGSFATESHFIWPDTFDSNSIINIHETFVLFRSNEPLLPDAGTTELPLGASTYYFRKEFEWSESPSQTELTLDGLVDDGAVVYLNGVEVYRHNMPSGPITHDTFATEAVDDLSSMQSIPIPSGILVSGSNVLAVEVHQATSDDADMLFGAELSATVGAVSQDGGLVMNEVAAASETSFWIELYNQGDIPLNVAGHVITTSWNDRYVLPSDTLEPGERLLVDETQLGFDAVVGERVFLYGPDEEMVLDGLRVSNQVRARGPEGDFPDGWGPWRTPDVATPGTENHFRFHDEIVINEIMYNHRLIPVTDDDGKTTMTESPEEWIELYNRGSVVVDLSGWTFADAIRYEFASGTTIAPGEYLVVAKDAEALRQKYETIEIVGDFSGRLSNTEDRIVLADALGNPADEVHYYEGGRWVEFADGGGSSLELRNPHADNSKGEAWAASDEGAKSQWVEYSYRGKAESSSLGPDGRWREFVIGLLQAGEVLLDDIRVTENPGGAEVEFLQNSTFESGTADTWRLIGTHRHSEVIVDPDAPENHVLRLVATASTEHMHNHGETTFSASRSVVNGREYEISFRAKWITGSNQLNTRLYFNRLARTTQLAMPELHGTPGMENSTFEANIGPVFDDFGHWPAVPEPGQPVTVSVLAEDPDDVAAMTLSYSVASGAFIDVPMTRTAGGLYLATIPGQAASTIVQFYVAGEDSLGTMSTYPALGADSRALFQVEDGRAATNGLHNIRIIMTSDDADFLHRDINLMSNDRVPATVIYNESEIFYDVGIRLKGSERGRVTVPRLGFNVGFNPEQLFRGAHKTVAIDRSSGTEFGQREILSHHTLSHAGGGLPSEYNDLIQIISPRLQHTGPAELQMARYTDLFLDSQYQNGSEGMLFEYELVYYPTSADANGYKRPQPDSVVGTSIRKIGESKEDYRHAFLIKNNRGRDDYDGLMQFAEAFGKGGSTFHETIDQYIDVDQWLRAFAAGILSGSADNYVQGAQHNAQFYVRPSDGRVLFLPHDLDGFYSATRPVVAGDVNKLISKTANARRYYGHLYDIINTTYNPEYMSYWTDHYGSFLPGQNFGSYLSFITQRSNYARNAVMGYAPQVPFSITTNGGADLVTDDVMVTIEGNAWIDVRDIYLNGSPDPIDVSWTGKTAWEITLPLNPGENWYTFTGMDFDGNAIVSDQIIVTSTAVDRPMYDGLRITELNYNPAPPTDDEIALGYLDNDDFEFIELKNIGDVPLDLTGVQFTEGIRYEFTGTFQGQPILLSEIGTRTPDYVELHNISPISVNTTGWKVVVNNPGEGLNVPHETAWDLSGEMAAGEVRYRSDAETDPEHYWNENIRWSTSGDGWAMLLDAQGALADFVVWGYEAAEFEAFSVTVDGTTFTAADVFNGAPVETGGPRSSTLQRSGSSDHDNASDWAFLAPASKGIPNETLVTPFAVKGIQFEPGQTLVLAQNRDAFLARYGETIGNDTALVLGPYSGKLSNGGERIRLDDQRGRPLFDFRYSDSNSWPGRADGKGASLELVDSDAVPTTNPERGSYLETGAVWRSSTMFGGSPMTEGYGLAYDVVVNEVLTNTDNGLLDAIELHNTTDAPIDVGGWFLSDSWGWTGDITNGDYRKFQIPVGPGSIIPPHDYLVFDESDFNPIVPLPDQTPFALDGAHGEDVWLVAGNASGELTRFVDHVSFGAAASGESFGRWPNATGSLVPMTETTLGDENSGPRVGPIVISEIMYDPAAFPGPEDLAPWDREYVEIYNPTNSEVNLDGWRLRGGVDYNFAEHEVLAPGATLVVIPFNPRKAGNEARWATFREVYNLPEEAINVFTGGYQGQLNNAGETVRLQRPDLPPIDEPDYVPHIMEDEVAYAAVDPWPAANDGVALHRLGLDKWGHAPESWTADAPTPGTVDLAAETAQVIGRHLFYNNSAFDGYLLGLGVDDDGAIATDKHALLPGENATKANYTNYTRGINGILIDITGLANATGLTAADFEFRVGNDSNPGQWPTAPAPSDLVVRLGAGTDGSDRVGLTWADGAIVNTWLQVTVRATADTGLAEDHVFYYGNAVGETGNSPTDAMVTIADELLARNSRRGLGDPAAIDDPVDFNRDRLVNVADRLIARNSKTGLADGLQLIAPPAVGGLSASSPYEADLSADWLNDLASAVIDASYHDSSHPKQRARASAVDRLLETFAR